MVDPGRYTYSESGPNWRRWFKGTAAHNTVTVDGLDQTPYRRGKPKRDRVGPRPGAVAAPQRPTDLDVVRAEVHSPCYDAVHTRDVVFVAGEYWLVADHLAAATPHDYSPSPAPHGEGLGPHDRRRDETHDVVVRAPDVDLVYAGGHAPR